MGQHKYNQTAIAAKNGELQPKSKKLRKKLSKWEREMYLQNTVENTIRKMIGVAPSNLLGTYTDGKRY